MSIRLRFTIALTLIGVVLFGTYGVLAYRAERNDLRAAATREIRIVGRSLDTALGNALRDRQKADIDETLTTLEALEPDVDIHIHEADGRPLAHSRGAVIDDEIEHFLARAALARTELVEFEPDDEPRRLVFAAPLTGDDGTLLGGMALVRPVTDLDEDLARTRWRMIAVVVAFLTATMIAGVVLGSLYVARPLASVLDGVRHVRDGDFRSPLRHGRDDEIGALVIEFNAMITALADARERIEQETDARTRLERGLERVDKMITIGQLSAGLAHEIGSPLQVMTARAAVLAAHSDPDVQRQAKLVVEQSDRITRIVEQLLSFGRHRAAVIAPCDLATPVKSVVELMTVEARHRGVTVAVEIDEHSHSIDADPDQLQQIALNLIRNALAATPAKGTITIRIDTLGDRVRLTVRDTGVGIPAAVQARLFEPFFTTRAPEGGTGLGLAVVNAIAHEHHATIDVHSEIGVGSEFVVGFPRRAEEPLRG